MKWLTRIEEIMLLAIWKLKDQAYGIAIRECNISYPLGQYLSYSKQLLNAS
jgi:hypothetical protein